MMNFAVKPFLVGLGAISAISLIVYHAGKPWTRHQCIVMAAEMPNDYGSAIMLGHCDSILPEAKPMPWEMNWRENDPIASDGAGAVNSDKEPRDLFEEAAKARGQTID